MELKLCKDCKHYKTIMAYDLCDHPSAKHSPIDGTPISQCFMVRDVLVGKCGVDGRLFEQKPVPSLQQPRRGSSYAGTYGGIAPAGDHLKPWWKRIFGG